MAAGDHTREELPVSEFWDASDWAQVLGRNDSAEYAGKRGAAPVIREEDIRQVRWLHAESPEDYGSVDMACVAELADGQWAICEAWADTTGWGCRDVVTWKTGPTLESVLPELTEKYREMAREALA